MTIQSNLGQKEKCKLAGLPFPVGTLPSSPARRLQTKDLLNVSNLPNRYCTSGTGLPEVDEPGILPTKGADVRVGGAVCLLTARGPVNVRNLWRRKQAGRGMM